MKVYKFGGASLKDSEALSNLLKILKLEKTSHSLCIIVSAMAKTTNALENLLKAKWNGEDVSELLVQIYDFHEKIAQDSIRNFPKNFESAWTTRKKGLEEALKSLEPGQNFDRAYDQVIIYGEIFSSFIVQQFLESQGLDCKLMDARDLIHTDQNWRDANVDWKQTRLNIQRSLKGPLKNSWVLSQGFIASYGPEQSTTLGREGSDYSAAIFATCLEAQELTIWKDVPGVLNADPKRVPDAQLYAQLSYAEAAEMSRYGATVIHPKTIYPLSEKKIPLRVRSFLYPSRSGTVIDQTEVRKFLPNIMFKDRQMLIEVERKGFGFLNEVELSIIFQVIARLGLKVNLLHKSARALVICMDERPLRIKSFQKMAGENFLICTQHNLELLSIKNGEEALIAQITLERKVVLESKDPSFYQAVLLKS